MRSFGLRGNFRHRPQTGRARVHSRRSIVEKWNRASAPEVGFPQVTRSVFLIEQSTAPQRLKPHSLAGLNGTAEAVPFPKSTLGRRLVFQRNHRAAVAAEGGNFLQVAVGAGHGHDRALAVYGVSVGGKIPTPAFGALGHRGGRLGQGFLRRQLGYRQTQQQG